MHFKYLNYFYYPYLLLFMFLDLKILCVIKIVSPGSLFITKFKNTRLRSVRKKEKQEGRERM